MSGKFKQYQHKSEGSTPNFAYDIDRSSHQKCSVKKGVLRNFVKFKENTCVKVSFLKKLQMLCETLLKKRPSTGDVL